MGTKTISITEEAYERLAGFKGKNESFSEVINKITRKRSLLDFVGLLSKKDAEDLRKNIRTSRKRSRDRMEKITNDIR